MAKKIYIRARPDQPVYNVAPPPRSLQSAEEGGGCLCFILGFLFSIIGVLIAAIIGKRAGVISALWGMVLSAILAGIGWFIIFLIA